MSGPEVVVDTTASDTVDSDTVDSDTADTNNKVSETAPLFSVVKGKPTDEELVALVAVLTATAGGAAPISKPVPSAWTAYWRSARTPLVPGAGAWSASARR